eukprot:TRINITY_DN23623_c0_g1_i2.p1 TRINITY_DN23623_c0_g1~~TRINITY_DN23623_c0_g1_i2.p1  ORF type:complete len:474 (+),score=103.47 TRINITY_DN23623_c0_g1_i2:188-1609(+)
MVATENLSTQLVVEVEVASVLSRLELVHQVAAADIRAQGSGRRDGGLAGLPISVLSALAAEARAAEARAAEAAAHSAAMAAAQRQASAEVKVQEGVCTPFQARLISEDEHPCRQPSNRPATGRVTRQQAWRRPPRQTMPQTPSSSSSSAAPAASPAPIGSAVGSPAAARKGSIAGATDGTEVRCVEDAAASTSVPSTWRTLRRPGSTSAVPQLPSGVAAVGSADVNVNDINICRASAPAETPNWQTTLSVVEDSSGKEVASSTPQARFQVQTTPMSTANAGAQVSLGATPDIHGGVDTSIDVSCADIDASNLGLDSRRGCSVKASSVSLSFMSARQQLNAAACEQSVDAAPLLEHLRSLLLDCSELTNWCPSADDQKLAKASILADDVPRLIEELENAVLDAVLVDTVAELTRVSLVREIHKSGENRSSFDFFEERGGSAESESSGVQVAARFIDSCMHFEDELRKKYSIPEG